MRAAEIERRQGLSTTGLFSDRTCDHSCFNFFLINSAP